GPAFVGRAVLAPTGGGQKRSDGFQKGLGLLGVDPVPGFFNALDQGSREQPPYGRLVLGLDISRAGACNENGRPVKGATRSKIRKTDDPRKLVFDGLEVEVPAGDAVPNHQILQ